MNPQAAKRSIIATAIALVGTFLAYYSVPKVPIAPQGIFLPIAAPQAPLAFSRVHFYSSLMVPYANKQLGYINVQYYSKRATPEEEDQLQTYVRGLAADAGSNAVIVTAFGHTIPGTIRTALSSYIFRGTAIYTTPSN